tara:strand:+ start:511 stop:1404 length:894 start_codon:yes stop_codon:yes gene_type:complete
MIKHIVLSGGGPNNIIQLGCLKCLYDSKIINRNEIESIYATSAGAILGLTIILKYDIDIVCDYFIKRPWSKVFNFKPKYIIEILENNGYMDRTFVEDMLDTFLTAKDVSKDISLIEMYNKYKVRFNIYTIRLESFDKLVLNHENYPSMPVKTAILMSIALPPIFKPVLYNGSYYIDGGMICNYPIIDCILRYKNINEIIGLHVCSGTEEKTTFSDDVAMPDYSLMLLGILITRMQKQNYISNVNEILIKSKYTAININAWKALLDDKEREAMFMQGIELAKEYIIKQNLKIDQVSQH